MGLLRVRTAFVFRTVCIEIYTQSVSQLIAAHTPLGITEDLGIPRPERGNLHGSQKPSSIEYEFYSYRMGMVIHMNLPESSVRYSERRESHALKEMYFRFPISML